jgi:hypothetical protein
MRMTMFRAKLKRAWLARCHTGEERRAVTDACTVDELTAAVNMIRRREAEDDRRLAAMGSPSPPVHGPRIFLD